MTSWTGHVLLERYRVGAQIGRGGMGAVYVADDLRRPGWRVAVKHPLRAAEGTPGGLPDEELRRRFHAEVGKLIALGEIPGIVRIEDQGEHEGTPFYVMRFLPGGALDARLKAGPQAPDAVVAWAGPIARALDRLHARTPMLVHRDVKPPNILFDDYDQAHLADFGIVKELSAAWATTGAPSNTGLGTPFYMAPEQVLPDGEVDGRTDQYALAATMYQALTGLPPRYETAPAASRTPGPGGTGGAASPRKRLKPVRELAPHVTRAAAAAVERGLAKEQSERFATCRALVDAFAEGTRVQGTTTSTPAAAEGGGTRVVQAPAPDAGRAQRPPGGRRRPRRALLLVVIVLLLGGGAFAMFGLQGRRNDPPSKGGPGPEVGVIPKTEDPPIAAKDETAPTITLQEPAGGETTTAEERIVLRGVVADAERPLAGVRLEVDGAAVPMAADGAFSHEVALQPDQTREVKLVATDAAGNASAPVVRKLRREAAWEPALRDALAAMAKDDGDAVKAALARPEASAIPHGRVLEVAAFAALWDRDPLVQVTSTVPVGSAPKAGESRTVHVTGLFTTGRKRDRLFVEDRDVTSPSGFEVDLTRPGPGTVEVPFEIRTGEVVRLKGALTVTFPPDAPVGPSKPEVPGAEPPWAAGLVSADQRAEATRLGRPVAFEEPTTGMRFVLVPGGQLRMGSPGSEAGREEHEGPQHVVTLSPFYLAVHEVTNAQFRRFKPTHDSAGIEPLEGTEKGKPHSQNGDAQPAVWVSHDEAGAYVRWLSESGKQKGFRLPSEAQWEHACRAGSTASRPWTGDLAEAHRHGNAMDPVTAKAFGYGWSGWPTDDGHRVTAPVGSYRPNAWGFHDMIGNAAEWCSDRMGPYAAAPQTDPEGPAEGKARVIRGGSWFAVDYELRSAHRAGFEGMLDYIGFRVALPASAVASTVASADSVTPDWAVPLVSAAQHEEAKRLGQPVAFENPLGMRFVLIPAGTFRMGSPANEPDRLESETPHKVTLTKAYYLQTTEVTFAQYQRWDPAHGLEVAYDRQWPAKYALDDPLQPVVKISLAKAKEFAAWVSQQGDERAYRLPTEAEWEHACRAGTTGPWWWGAQASEAARCANVADRDWNQGTWKMTDGYLADFDFVVKDGHVVAAPVGSYRPNPWGLYDMLGNAWEMCLDWAQVWPAADQVDPVVRVAPGGPNRVAQGLAGATLGMVTGDGPGTIIRGGCWGEHRWSVRAAARASLPPAKDLDVIGFRLLVEVK